MKQVVKKQEVDTVDLSEVSDSQIYAFTSLGVIYVLRYSNCGYEFYPLGCSGLFLPLYTRNTIEECLGLCLKRQEVVYEFDNVKGLAEWLVKECK